MRVTIETMLEGSLCRGQKATYNCSSNTHFLTWVATIPGLEPISITHNSANFSDVFVPEFNITTMLIRNTCDREYTESLITFTLPFEIMLECKVADIASTILEFSSPSSSGGKYLHCLLCHALTVLMLSLVPPSPNDFRVSQGVEIDDYIISTFEWNPPVSRIIVDFYRISISPQPLSHPTSNLINASSTSWDVTLDASTIYTVSIIAINCAGESTEATITVGKLFVIIVLQKIHNFIL